MEEKIKQTKSETNATKGGDKKDCVPKDGGAMKSLGISLIVMVVVAISMFFGVIMGIIIHRDYTANEPTAVEEAGASLVTVALSNADGGEWEFSIADGTTVEYLGRASEQVQVKVSENSDDTETETRNTFYFQGVKEGETTVTMNYRKDGSITETKVYKVSVDGELAATTTIEQ